MSRFEVGLASSSEGVDVFDVHSGTFLRSIAIQNSHGGLVVFGDEHFLVCQEDKAFLQIWSWRTGGQKLRCLLPEKPTVLCMSRDANYLAAGTASGKVYLWSMATGDLLTCFHAHYKKVSALCFTTDDAFLLTGGDDSVVNAWLFDTELVSPNPMKLEPPQPWIEFSQHSLPISGLYCGVGGMAGRVVSSSLDRTCKIFDLPSKSMLHSFLFPCFLNAVVLDPAEQVLLAAGGDGKIYKVNIAGGSAAEGGQGQGRALEGGYFVGHEQSVTGLSMSFNGSILMSTSKDGTAAMWDASTSQLLRRLNKNRTQYLGCAVVQDSFGLAGAGGQPTKSNKSKAEFYPLQRISNARPIEEVVMPVSLRGPRLDIGKDRSTKFRDEERMWAAWNDLFGQDSNRDLQSRFAEQARTQQETAGELDRWKAVHAQLYSFCADKLANEVRDA
jgi:pre-rRNA-processing protein IPI3